MSPSDAKRHPDGRYRVALESLGQRAAYRSDYHQVRDRLAHLSRQVECYGKALRRAGIDPEWLQLVNSPGVIHRMPHTHPEYLACQYLDAADREVDDTEAGQ